jgi:hypothetical protein
MFHVYIQLIRCDSRLGLSMSFVVETTDSGEKFVYDPCPDFHVSIDLFPYIILEVNSRANESDKYRIQAACISRMGHMLRLWGSEHIDKPIFNMAIYIDWQFMAHQHILCQSHNLRRVMFNWFRQDRSWLT